MMFASMIVYKGGQLISEGNFGVFKNKNYNGAHMVYRISVNSFRGNYYFLNF